MRSRIIWKMDFWGIVLIRLAQVGRPALCGWRHSLKWNPRLLKGGMCVEHSIHYFLFLDCGGNTPGS